ncbi:unnamed protein product [Caenorhabditis auriculariae]|uniref:Large ribosomal subunit protein uL22 n=1 Tax=Caenorhabditis auriculariae TaxID=2777116 RepID=A0A8S1GTZ5_9PELO|nr:unnamed protein product [Caenorhabditis auriculariae]
MLRSMVLYLITALHLRCVDLISPPPSGYLPVAMTKIHYSRAPENSTKSCKARGSDLRVHFKNTYETAMAIRDQKELVPFFKFNGGVGRKAQAKHWNTTQGRWPTKSADFVLDLLKNAESNAEYKGLDVDHLVVDHINVQRAAKMRRRTYRAHGRINPYMSSPCHIEVILAEKEDVVSKPAEDVPKVKKESKRKQRRQASVRTVSILGDLAKTSVNDQLTRLKEQKLDRIERESSRECLLAASLYSEGKKANVDRIAKLLKKSSADNELRARTAAFGAALALKTMRLDKAHVLLEQTTKCPPIISTSIRVCVFSKEAKVDEALKELERTLTHEEILFDTENYSISEEALDTLHSVIKELPETSHQMKKFRTLQRMITRYGRRSKKSIDECLNSPFTLRSVDFDPPAPPRDGLISDKTIRDIPHFLAGEQK